VAFFLLFLFTIATFFAKPALRADEALRLALIANVGDRFDHRFACFLRKYIRPFGFRGETNPTTLRYFLAK
jgi:hypothetical protein